MLNIFTRCSRIENLTLVQQSLEPFLKYINWVVLLDTNAVKQIPTELFQKIRCNFKFYQSNNDLLYPALSETIKALPPHFIEIESGKLSKSYVYILDDDNIIHPNFFDFYNSIKDTGKGYVFNQKVDKKDFTGLDIREAKEENMKLQGVDAAQLLFPVEFFKYDFEPDYAADGIFIEKMYPEFKDRIEFVDRVLCYYNYLEKSTAKDFYLPKVLYIGEGTPKLETLYYNSYSERRLNVEYLPDDTNLTEVLVKFNPDSIITVGDPAKHPNLNKQPLEVRNRWYNLDAIDHLAGEHSYSVGMNYILNNDKSKLISFFTSTYNTGDKILDTYSTLRKQTYDNWEWVIVDDSTDDGHTYKILKNLQKFDHRVKLYSFDKKTNGIVGEAKYRAACLTEGVLLAELDHDDLITPDCAEYLMQAYNEFPDAGFYYTDGGEVTEDYNAIIYPEGFAMGYGKYYTSEYNGNSFEVQVTPNINPLTIRHIVGVPNHIRCWRRDIYFSAGGHNRRLTIADDYELILRTFLRTIFVKIPKMCYIQFRYDEEGRVNTHETSRADIQRRVYTIMNFYNEKIKDRFEELGVKDWAYDSDPKQPLNTIPRFNEKENYVNYTLNIT